MQRSAFMVSVAGVFAATASAGVAANVPDVTPFQQPLFKARETAAADIWYVHHNSVLSPTEIDAMDRRYLKLLAAANAFWKSVAFQIEFNQAKLEQWNADCANVLDQAKAFDTALDEIDKKHGASPDRGVFDFLAKVLGIINPALGAASTFVDFKKKTGELTEAQRKSFADGIRREALWPDPDTILRKTTPAPSAPASPVG